MSVGVIFSTATGRYQVFDEARVNELVERLRRADLVVGFNVLNFDYQVLMGYTVLDLIHELPTADLMIDVEKASAIGSGSIRLRTPPSGCKKPPSAWTQSAGGARGACWRSPNIAVST